MATLSHTRTAEFATGSVSAKGTYSGSLQISVAEACPNSATTQIALTLDVSAVKAIMIYSDRALTLKTNSASTPDNTIVLKAGVPYIWDTDSYESFLLTTDVTSLHLVNASGGSASFQLAAVIDATP